MAILHESAAFLSALTWRSGWNEEQTFFTISDKKNNPSLTSTIHGSLAAQADVLTRLNDLGAGIFVTVNKTDGKGRTSANIVKPRAVFIDADGELSKPWAIQPTVIVKSKRGVHFYWVLWEGESIADFTTTQKKLARYYGSDPSVHDLPRVMRLPGFFHHKAEPFMVSIVENHPHRAYGLEQVVAAHPVPEPVLVHRSAPQMVPRGVSSYQNWSKKREASVGSRHKTAFSIAAEGFVRGFDEDVVLAITGGWCDEHGIGSDVGSVVRSARRNVERRTA